MDETQQEFAAEVIDLAEKIVIQLSELRSGDSGQTERQLLEAVFRHMHSIKGCAAAGGIDQASTLAHECESALAAVREGRLSFSPSLLDAIEECATLLGDLVRFTPGNDLDTQTQLLVARLRELTTEEGRPVQYSIDHALNQLPGELWQSLNEEQKHHLTTALAADTPVHLLTIEFDIADFDRQIYRLREKLEEIGEVLSTNPQVADEHPDRVQFQLLFISRCSPPEIRAGVQDFEGLSLTTLTKASDASKRDSSVERTERIQLNSIRVDLGELEKIDASLHELVELIEASQKLVSERVDDPAARNSLAETHQKVTHHLRQVEEQLAHLRVVSLGGVLKRAERAGRAAARLANKSIGFLVDGFDLGLDKRLADAIASPLVHLVRNAVDHGIESADERLRLGKDIKGVISIEARRDVNTLRILVRDDGRGIDPALVSRVATERGLIDTEGELNLDECVELLFRPGFSTTQSVSTTSGRGVGLDVVAAGAKEAGGEVRVESEPGHGTTFEIRLPFPT